MTRQHQIDVSSPLLRAIADGRCLAVPVPDVACIGDLLVLSDGSTQTLREVTYIADGTASLGFPRAPVGGITSIGIDPGFASTGLCVLRRDSQTGDVMLVDMRVVKTKKDSSLKAGEDDLRRIALFRSEVEPIVRWYCPNVLSAEQYTIFDTRGVDELRASVGEFVALLAGVNSAADMGRAFSNPRVATTAVGALQKMKKVMDGMSSHRGRGAAAKTVGVFHVLSDIGHRLGIPVTVQPPVSLKTAATGKRSASKKEVEDGMCTKVQGLREALDARPKGEREHLADAAGHAFIGLQKYETISRGFGL